MLRKAVGYPRNGANAPKTVLVGGVLTLLGFLVIPAIIVLGYLVRVLRATFADQEEPPVFDRWGELTVDGVKAFAVTLAYFLLPMAVFTGAGGVTAWSSLLAGELRPGVFAGAAVLWLLGGVLWLVAWYALPVALATFAREDRIGAAFSFEALRPTLLNGTYAVNWLLALGLFVVAGIVTSLLNAVPFLGFVVGAFVTFYAAVAAFYIYGHGVSDARAVEPAPESPPGQPAA